MTTRGVLVLMPEFVAIYRRLGRGYRLPILLVKELERYSPTTYAGPADPARYDAQARKLAGMFVENFKQFERDVQAPVKLAGPVV